MCHHTDSKPRDKLKVAMTKTGPKNFFWHQVNTSCQHKFSKNYDNQFLWKSPVLQQATAMDVSLYKKVHCN